MDAVSVANTGTAFVVLSIFSIHVQFTASINVTLGLLPTSLCNERNESLILNSL